jgi:hypothetical protein
LSVLLKVSVVKSKSKEMCLPHDMFSIFKEHPECRVLKITTLGISKESIKKLKIKTARTDYFIKSSLKGLES